MKKAKIMLSAIAILAVVGGAFAFKAKSKVAIYTGTTSTLCTQLTNVGLTDIGTTVHYSTTSTTFCPLTTIVTNQEQ